jgi:formate dehydrogenase major subunit
MGSNMAECHPVGFQWVVEAKRRGATVIHVDPRFTRTSALADLHVPLRAGSDIAFLGALVNHILEGGHEFREYVRAYTNAATILREDFRDTEDLDGLFSGWDPETRTYDGSSWHYEGLTVGASAGQREVAVATTGEQAHGAHGGELEGGEPPEQDPTLEHPRCVFQVLKRHFARYTPELVEDVCGVTREQFLRVADALVANSGRERTTAFCYAVGWTQHTVGVQYIRTAAIVQLLLGNIGRPGGGILALRGHATIQGSTDIPTLYNILPGYLPMPHPHAEASLDLYVERNAPTTGYWGYTRAYTVSLLKAWWGEAATRDNDFCFDRLPRITGDHSHHPTTLDMADGKVEGFFVMGENPVVGSANSGLQRKALERLRWLVVRDFRFTETAEFWREAPDCETEIFFLPAATHTEKDGTYTNTQRLLQWHHKALEPPGDCRSELHFMFHLGRRVRELLAESDDPKDRGILELVWDYPVEGPCDEPRAAAVLEEIGGWDPDGRPLRDYLPLRDDGSTACGCWIYAGCYADGVNQAARRRPGSDQSWVAPEWGWAWPMNRRILYNRASADPEGRPWSERKRYVWWDEDAGRWVGEDVPDFPLDMDPGYVPPEGARAHHALRGDHPFVMQADGKGWLYAPTGLVDGPLPAHYEPHESPVDNPLYGQGVNPARTRYERDDNRYHAPGSPDYPFVLTTYRLTEHHTAGAMTRPLPYLAELQPEMFCEVSPDLAAERGLENGGWATIATARATIEARVLVTDRMAPLTVRGRRVHQVGLPYHWGRSGYTRGDAANELLPIVLDPNVDIGEYKAATCDVRPGRRPR